MTFRTGLLAVCAFGVVMLGAVALLTRPEAPPPARPAPLAIAAAPEPAPVTSIASPAPVAPRLGVREPKPLPAWADPAQQPTPRERALAARLMPAKTKFLLARAVERARPELRSCFPDAPRIAVRHLAASRRALGQGAIGTLVLRLHPEKDRFLVVDAAVARKGSASDEELACAVEAVRGLTLPFPGAVPGTPATLMYPID